MSALWNKISAPIHHAILNCLQFGDSGDVSLQKAIVRNSRATFHFDKQLELKEAGMPAQAKRILKCCLQTLKLTIKMFGQTF